MSDLDGIGPKRLERIRKELTAQLRHQIADELRLTIRRQVEGDIRSAARQDVLREIREREPTGDERQRVRDLVQDMELDAYAQATIASSIADDSQEQLERSRRWSSPLAYGFTLAFLPLVYALSRFQASGWAFAASTVTLAVALLMVLSSSLRRHLELERSVGSHRKVASDYLILAERAKAYRMLHIERSVAADELYELVEELRRDKERQDRAFHPTAGELRAARLAAQSRFAAPLRVQPDEDELAEEAEAVTDHEA